MTHNNQVQNIERYSPSISDGLSALQVSTRQNQGLTNFVKQKYSKSYLSIFIGNVCTFFNLLGLTCLVALLAIGATLSNFFFVIFYQD